MVLRLIFNAASMSVVVFVFVVISVSDAVLVKGGREEVSTAAAIGGCILSWSHFRYCQGGQATRG